MFSILSAFYSFTHILAFSFFHLFIYFALLKFFYYIFYAFFRNSRPVFRTFFVISLQIIFSRFFIFVGQPDFLTVSKHEGLIKFWHTFCSNKEQLHQDSPIRYNSNQKIFCAAGRTAV